MLLPLDSPHWDSLDAFFSTPDALEALREIVATGRLGEAWKRLRDEIHHQGGVSPMAFDFDFGDPALRHLAAIGPLRRLHARVQYRRLISRLHPLAGDKPEDGNSLFTFATANALDVRLASRLMSVGRCSRPSGQIPCASRQVR